MPEKIASPTVIASAGTLPKTIEEFVGRVNTGETGISIARMRSPQGWEEPAQTPGFDEYTFVLSGLLVVEHDEGKLEIGAGEAVHARFGERVRYSTPAPGGAEYIAVCVPAFSPQSVNREEG
jgi:mannose-6-phosphate isomerase-like protein (cupin superfamily)